MTERPLAIFLVVVAFLLSAWGNLIAAAFCPRYLAQNCFAHITQQANQGPRESCHHETDMDMGDMQMDGDSATEAEVTSARENPPLAVAKESSDERTALDLPTQPCGHCWMHSQPSSGTGTLAAVDPSPRSVEALAPSVEIAFPLPSLNPTVIEVLEHGPPGNSFPRHILNVFRI